VFFDEYQIKIQQSICHFSTSCKTKIMDKIKWGIIGCGDVAEVKSGPAFQLTENSELIAVMRRDGEKAKDFAFRHQVPFWYYNATELLKNKEINAVYIATPPSTHLKYALEALDAGKHVYLEKPMVLSLQEAKILSKKVKEGNHKLTIAHYRRCLPAFLKVKELLDTNAIGEIRFADIQILQPSNTKIIAKSSVNWRLDSAISGGGYFHDLAPHQIDLMLYYFGTYKSAFGYSLNQEKVNNSDDIVNGVINFKSGILFRGLWCFNISENTKKDNCTIYGSKGTISFSFYGEEVIVNYGGLINSYKFKNPTNIQQPMIHETVNYFLEKGKNPCTVEEGVIVMDIMDTFCKK
jgi:predicted dehydrogenase